MAGGEHARSFGLVQDVTADRRALLEARFRAEHDPLTGLGNRQAFQAVMRAAPRPPGFPGGIRVLMLIDLDNFKDINDSFGHPAGDACIRQMAARLKQSCASAEIIARVGGDEFALTTTVESAEAVETLVEDVLAACRQPVLWEGSSFQLSASLGLALAVAPAAARYETLLVEADLALYAAKDAGRNTARLFTPDLKRRADARVETLRALAGALEDGALDLHYQPRVRLDSGALVGLEALLRWRRPDGSMVPARAFPAVFDDPELSLRIGTFVIDSALAQAAAWAAAGLSFGHVAINLSPTQVRDPLFGDQLLARIEGFGLDPARVEVELTEGVFLNARGGPVRDILERLRRGGVRIVLDDFGTASLTHLRDYPVDRIKIAQSFVAGLMRHSEDIAIVQALVFLGRRLGIDVVAEGIETLEQRLLLGTSGCLTGQGYFFAPPLPASAVERDWLRRGQPPGLPRTPAPAPQEPSWSRRPSTR